MWRTQSPIVQRTQIYVQGVQAKRFGGYTPQKTINFSLKNKVKKYIGWKPNFGKWNKPK